MWLLLKASVVIAALVVGSCVEVQHNRVDMPIPPSALQHIDKVDTSAYMTPEEDAIFKATVKAVNERGNQNVE